MWKQRWIVLVSLLAGALGITGPAARAGPLGEAFRVHGSPTGIQQVVDVASGANGDVLVLWSYYEAGTVFMQRYDGAGQPLQAQEVAVGAGASEAALDRYGNFAIVRQAADGSGDGIYLALYDRAGRPRMREFRVNDTTFGEQRFPLVAMNAQGDFAVAWTHKRGDFSDVYVKRFRRDGTPIASETLAAPMASERKGATGLGMDRAGNIAVSWGRSASGGMDVWMRRFDSAGVPFGAPVRVNTQSALYQDNSRLAMSPQGDFVVVWERYGQTWNAYAQRYYATGAPRGSEVQLTSQGTGMGQLLPDVAMLEDGSFVVSYLHWSETERRLRVRQFHPNGTAAGPELSVIDAPAARSFWSRVAMRPSGTFLVAWDHHDPLQPETDRNDVLARWYVMDTLPPVMPVGNGQTLTELSGTAGSWRYFKLTVPDGVTTLAVSLSGPSTGGDADLYVRHGALPTADLFDVRPYLDGSNEGAVIQGIPPGDWVIGINGYSDYSSVSLSVTAW